MTMTNDQIIDRRRLRRKLSFWRIAAFVLLAGLIVALARAGGALERYSKRGSDHIARVEISGVITNDRQMVELIQELGKKNHVKAVLFDISSPGGSTVGGEALYEAVRELGEKKPVVSSVGTLAASAGYMLACATDHIVARRSSLVGSIGVFIQYGDVADLLDKLGVNVEIAKSSPLKAEPSPFAPASEEAKQMLEGVVKDTYEWFVALVAERRGFNEFKARQLADGSIYTGSQGKENGLVDEIGDEETARKWLVANRGISENLKFVDWKPRNDNVTGLVSAVRLRGFLLEWLGFDTGGEAGEAIGNFIKKRLFLDGLSSLMQT